MSSIEEVWREPEVRRRIGVSHATLWRMRKRGEFPNPVRVGSDAGAVGYLASEVQAWLQARIARRAA